MLFSRVFNHGRTRRSRNGAPVTVPSRATLTSSTHQLNFSGGSVLVPRPARLGRSLTDAAPRPSITATATCLIRATEQHRQANARLVDDPYARLFLPEPLRTLAGSRYRPLRSMALADPLTLGTPSFVLLRHRFIDDLLRTALAGATQQVIVMGAGYDTRAYRFADALHDRPIFEVDLPGTSQTKATIAQRQAADLPHSPLHRVEIDFERASLADTLLDAGFAPDTATFVVWEGVTPYLTADAVRDTLGALSKVLGPGSVIAAEFAERPVGALDPTRVGMCIGESVLAAIGERPDSCYRETNSQPSWPAWGTR